MPLGVDRVEPTALAAVLSYRLIGLLHLDVHPAPSAADSTGSILNVCAGSKHEVRQINCSIYSICGLQYVLFYETGDSLFSFLHPARP